MKKVIVITLSVLIALTIMLPAAALTSIPVTGIKLSTSNLTLIVKQTYQLKVTLTPANTTQKTLTYITNNKNIATINTTGKITAIGIGTTTVTVYTNNKKLFSKCNVTVKPNPLMKYSPYINMTVGQYVGGTNSFPAGESPENNVSYTMVRNYIGIQLIPKFTAPNGDPYHQKLKLQIAANDIPDMSFCDTNELDMLIKANMIVDLTPYYNEYASDYLKGQLGYRNGVSFVPAIRGNKIYGLPSVTDANNGVPLMYIRKDWLDALGLSVPRTLGQVYAVAKAFVNDDPDKNGVKDTFGIVLSKELDTYTSWPIWAIANAYGAYPTANSVYPWIFLKDAQGKITYGSIQPNVKNVLAQLHYLYNDGVFDKEFATKDFNTVTETIAAGKVGILFGEFWSPLWPLADTLKNNPKADWECYPVPGAAGIQIKPYTPLNVQGYYFIRKGYQHPEALVIALNHRAEVDNGRTTDPFALNWQKVMLSDKYKNYSIHAWLPFYIDKVDKNVQYSADVVAALNKKDPSRLTPTEKTFYNNVLKGGIDNWPLNQIYTNSMPQLLAYKDFQFSAYNGAPTDSMGKYKSVLDQLELTTFTQIITGAKPLSEFDNFVIKWKQLGGTKILNEINSK